MEFDTPGLIVRLSQSSNSAAWPGLISVAWGRRYVRQHCISSFPALIKLRQSGLAAVKLSPFLSR
jgi:hypothetical protein